MLGYLFGVFLCIGGVGTVFNGSFLIGVTLIAMGLVSMPVTFEKISAKINLEPDPKNKRTLIVVLIIVLMIVGYKPDENTKNAASGLADGSPVDQSSAIDAEGAATLMSELEEQLAIASVYPDFLVLKERIDYARKKITDTEQLARIDAIEQLIKPKIDQMEAAFEAEKAKEAEKKRKELAAFKSKSKSIFEIKREEIRDVSFYTNKRFKGLKNYVGAYIAADFNPGSSPVLRFKAMYYGSDWLFVESMRFKCANQSFYFDFPKYGDKAFERDNSGGSVWEYVDVIPSSEQLSLLRCAADLSNKVLMSFEGRQYRKDLTMGKPDQQAIKDTLYLYDNFKDLGF